MGSRARIAKAFGINENATLSEIHGGLNRMLADEMSDDEKKEMAARQYAELAALADPGDEAKQAMAELKTAYPELGEAPVPVLSQAQFDELKAAAGLPATATFGELVATLGERKTRGG